MPAKKKNKRSQRPNKNRKFELTPTLIILILILIFVLSGIAKIALSNTITEMNYSYEILKRRETRYRQEVSELKAGITELSRPDRIRNYAKRELGMTEYSPDTRVLVVE